MRPASVLALLPIAAGFFPGERAAGQFTLWENAERSLELGGYVQTLSGLYRLGYDLPDTDRTSGFNAEVVRLKWTLRFGPSAFVEVHDRLQAQVASTGSGVGGSLAGIGVSVVPGRSLDLRRNLVEEERLQVWHDVDRLSLTIYSHLGDVTVGRQAITWGTASLFPVADLWAQFSPFELDTEEKPGIDALRILTYPGEGWEVDAVVADRGSGENLSAGLRAALSLSWADLYLAGGKFWNEVLAMGGVSAPVGSWKLRGEGLLPWDLDQDKTELPRLTLGVDWLGGETMLSGEYHFNGIGSTDADEYGSALADPRFARGESYYLGRHYLGGLAMWTPGNDRLSLTLSALANLQDPSAALTPLLTYDFGQETRVSAGAMLTFGRSPLLDPETALRSEYGTYGNLFFTRISVYF